MIVVRFKVKCFEKIRQATAAFRKSSRPAELSRVVNFDTARDLHDRMIIATEVFVDRAALERQESLPAVQTIIGLPEFCGRPRGDYFQCLFV